MRKALVVGVGNYPKEAYLKGSADDALAVGTILETHGDGSPNFDVTVLTNIATADNLLRPLHNLFEDENEAALFYFSGHGVENKLGAYLSTPDGKRLMPGVSMTDLLTLANNSPAKNKIIILDCCKSGAAGTSQFTGGIVSSLHNGITILTASQPWQNATEISGQGVFTSLLIAALEGGAADLTGKISPASIYSYIDKSLGAWKQRPVFKTNISHFISLRNVKPLIPTETLRKLTSYFTKPGEEKQLDPSFEFTDPSAIAENVIIFKDLQKLRDAGLVTPVGTEHMYFAAMEKKYCKLTTLGRHYWQLVSKRMI